jgi:hypothetical protein
VPLVHDPPGPSPPVVKDEQAPAAVVPADFGACQVDGAKGFAGTLIVAEERAGLGKFFKNAAVKEKVDLVGVDRHLCFLAGVLVAQKKTQFPAVFFYPVDQAEVAAALAALLALEWQGITPPGTRLLPSCLFLSHGRPFFLKPGTG